MKKFDCIYLMAGLGTRFDCDTHKGLVAINGVPFFTVALEGFLNHPQTNKVILVVHPSDVNQVKTYLEDNHYPLEQMAIVTGGLTRSESVRKGLSQVTTECFIIHDGVRPFVTIEDIDRILQALEEFDGVTFYHPVSDTIKQVSENTVFTLNRSLLKAVTTPQGFTKKVINYLINPQVKDEAILDEIMLIEKDFSIGFLLEKHSHHKLTTKDDFVLIQTMLNQTKMNVTNQATSVGFSFDFHPFVKKRPLILGGINIPFEYGLDGHSDADVVYHVVAESIMGALKLGDLGTLFPDTDPQYKNMASAYFIKEVMQHVRKRNVQILHIDIMIYLEKPKLFNYKKQMAENIAQLLDLPLENVNVKATTLEKRGFIGKGEGVAAEAICLVKQSLVKQ